ncbi:MAG: ParB N-terminal domain-containing protein [Blautia sp.]|nr:ParB N-terminal domain-containing protein [Blautia sp.]
MSVFNENYQKLVLDDLKNYKDLSQAIPASMPERLLIRELPISRLHPNPEDEFSMPSIGPNYEIVENYARQFRNRKVVGNDLFKDPLIVEKMSTGGYMILNGHHRWFAAHIVKLKKMPVQIANVVPKEEIISKITASPNSMCVSFDLDEVLLTDGKRVPAEDEPLPVRLLQKKTLRKNCCALVRALQKAGFDVWIYTDSHHSEKYIRALFGHHHAKVSGIINCIKKNNYYNEIRDLFRTKYKYSLHIDNEGIIWVNTETKEYDIIEIQDQKEGWAKEAITHIRKLDFVRKKRRG